MAEARGPQADLFAIPGLPGLNEDRLGKWQPQSWAVAPDWRPIVDHFLLSPAGQGLARFITARIAAGATIYPPAPLQALALTPLAGVKVVILGQDPYHGPGQADGLAFSVATGMKCPPSLRNIFKELVRDTAARGYAPTGDAPLAVDVTLARWAEQGVLLLNTCLSVEQGLPASHFKQGWEVLTDAIVNAVLGNGRPVVFMLWGAQAQKAAALVQASKGRHCVLVANHPSPLSALRPPYPFIGCGHFSKANAFLVQEGELAVKW